MADAPRVGVNPGLHGIFFEEINHAGEGGLYAEMVLNRDFEINTLPAGCGWAGNLLRTAAGWQERKWFGNALHGWSLVAEDGARGAIRQESRAPLNANNPHSLRLTALATGRRIGVANTGFWGMHFRDGAAYDLSFYARTEGEDRFDLRVMLENADGSREYAAAVVPAVAGPWKQYRCSLTASGETRHGRLAIAVNRPGTLWLDVVSLFPRDTFKGRPNGLRADLARMLADLKPAFVRFPGGAVAGGLCLDNRFQWKNSIGDIAQRKGTMNLWGYYSTNGLGYHEYLQFCEDIGADALFVCNPGMSDSYRHSEYAAEADLPSFVQEAIDAIEYAIGPPASPWGRLRAEAGHPAPFPLRHIEIGNEAGGEEYHARYQQFYGAIKARYPQLTIICNERRTEAPVEMVDDHFYGSPADLVQKGHAYDHASRNAPLVYVGEYACNTGVGEGNLKAALAEAVFMLGLERNGDLVRMASYAPLLFNVNDIAWPVNLIGFDNARTVGRSSYHVQKLFACNRPDEALATVVEGPGAGEEGGLHALAGTCHATGDCVLKVVNLSGETRAATVQLSGLRNIGPVARVTTLRHDDPEAENSLDDPAVVAPAETELRGIGLQFSLEFRPYSLTILRFAAR